MDVPEAWRAYACEDYLSSELARCGWWDAEGQCWYIEPLERVYEDQERQFLVIGRPGVDGIDWGYRKGRPGIWAHYLIENTFVLIAESASILRDGYESGTITV
jgi:hypothetical protein